MNYIIDGHNLIPALGLQLDSLDDEQLLVSRLQEFARLHRAHVEVYFDGALPEHARTLQAGTVKVHFIRRGSTADAAIEKRLEKLERTSRNWAVVSSDRRVQVAARAAHAAVLASDEFTRLMITARVKGAERLRDEAQPDPKDTEEWLRIFNKRD